MSEPKFTFEDISSLEFNKIIWIAAPIMFAFVLIEYLIGLKKNKKLYNGKDFLASSAVGLGNLVLNGLIKTGIFVVFLFFFNLAPFRIPHTWWSYIVCLILLDFCRYWAHRLAHEQRFWWSTHVVHHSSEHYNLSVSFRLSWTQNLKIIFFLPVVLMGFHPLVFFVAHQTAVLYQFWIHTELIRKLPRPIEYVFTTPSHHRVHHATNEKYLDKNYGSTFIIWDRMFGTFQPEEEQAKYGITKPVNSYNPVYLVFHAWMDLFRDVRTAKSFKEVWTIMFGSPVEASMAEMALMEIKNKAEQEKSASPEEKAFEDEVAIIEDEKVEQSA